MPLETIIDHEPTTLADALQVLGYEHMLSPSCSRWDLNAARAILTDAINAGDPQATTAAELYPTGVIRLRPVVGMKATLVMWSDRAPYEIVAVSKGGTKITLRAMKAELDPSWKPDFHPGGFAGHTANNDSQEWIVTSDSAGRMLVAHKGKHGWKSNLGTIALGTAQKFHDYNF